MYVETLPISAFFSPHERAATSAQGRENLAWARRAHANPQITAVVLSGVSREDPEALAIECAS